MNKIFISIVSVLIVATSCDKQESIPTRFKPTSENNANVKILLLSPDAPGVNIFANGSKITGAPASTTGNVSGFVFPTIYPGSVGYISLAPGSVKLEAKVPDSSSVMPGAVIATTTETLVPKKFYTYVLMDSMKKISTVLIEDDPTVPDPTKAYIRVGNFVSNSSSVNIEILKTSTGTPFSKVYPNVPFKSVTAFEAFEGGRGEVYRVFLRHPTTNAKLDSITSFTPVNTKKYTIYGRGVMGLTGTNTRRPIITFYTNF